MRYARGLWIGLALVAGLVSVAPASERLVLFESFDDTN
jgi:hypothetical protein